MRGTTNEDAWRAYLDGERLFTTTSRQQLQYSQQKFELTTRLDPGFARAWGWLAYVIARSVVAGWTDKNELATAETFALKAVELEYKDYATHWDLAFVFLYRRKFDLAKREYEIALDLYNNNTDLLDRKPGLLSEMGEALAFLGEYDAAVDLLKKAHRVPSWYKWNLAWACYNRASSKKKTSAAAARAEYQACVDSLEEIADDDPGLVSGMKLLLAAAYAQLGKPTKLGKAKQAFKAQRAKEVKDAEAPDYTPDKLRELWPFKDKELENHWIEGLTKARLP